MHGRFAGILLLVIASITIPVPARGQTPSGEISGTVVDASGLAVPGVTVTLTNAATNVVRTVQTNESGLYVITAIPPGSYDMKAESSATSSTRPAPPAARRRRSRSTSRVTRASTTR